jgi:MYXO-CTERM domain-containing protein
MKSKIALFCLALGALFSAPAARAAGPGDAFLALINGASEVPSTGSPGLGIGQLNVLSATDFQLIVSFSVPTGGSVSDAHIHLGAPGVNGGVVVNLVSAAFTGSRTITGTTTPSINGTYTGQGAFITALGSGTHYFNFHTTTFGGGEVRGNIVTAPEPSALAMGLVGLAALGLARRRKQG